MMTLPWTIFIADLYWFIWCPNHKQPSWMMTQGPTSCPPTGFICTFAGKSSNIDPFSDKPKCFASVVSSHDLSVSRRNVGNVKHIANVTLPNHTSIGIVGSCWFSLCCAHVYWVIRRNTSKHLWVPNRRKQRVFHCPVRQQGSISRKNEWIQHTAEKTSWVKAVVWCCRPRWTNSPTRAGFQMDACKDS